MEMSCDLMNKIKVNWTIITVQQSQLTLHFKFRQIIHHEHKITKLKKTKICTRLWHCLGYRRKNEIPFSILISGHFHSEGPPGVFFNVSLHTSHLLSCATRRPDITNLAHGVLFMNFLPDVLLLFAASF